MRNHQDERPSSRGGSLLRWTERLLVGAGAVMLAWYAFVMADAAISQRAARRSLETASHSAAPVYTREPDGIAGISLPAPLLQTGAAIAELTVPRVQLSAVVLHGSDARTLRRGPGHLENTALPGEPGNMVIAGHRDSFFRPLRDVKVGDDIFLGTQQGRFQYRVTSLDVVKPQDLSVLEPTSEATLTLITCYPFWVLGDAPDRFIVRAARVGTPAAAAITVRTAAPREPVPAPLPRQPAVSGPAVVDTPAAQDDDGRARAAIERFRIAYNARLYRESETSPHGLLKFQACNLTIADDQAEATCDAASSPDDLETPVWTLALERADEGWLITSVHSR